MTDVGDSAVIVGDTGRVVPPQDSQALADAWHELLTLDPDERAGLGQAARRRMEEHFDLLGAVAKYEKLYEEFALHGDPIAPLGASR